MILVSSWRCLCPIHWSWVSSLEWRCSWSRTDRRCPNYIWVINNLIDYKSASYIRDLTVSFIQYVGLGVFSLPISLLVVVRIVVLHFMIIIKSNLWIISQCLGSRVGVTKALLVDFSAREICDLSNVPVGLWEPRSYLTGVTAAELRRHLSIMNVIFNN